jgi:hypothetical protein
MLSCPQLWLCGRAHLLPARSGRNAPSSTGGATPLRVPAFTLRGDLHLVQDRRTFVPRAFGLVRRGVLFSNGTPPGVWYGTGLFGLGSDGAGRISAGDEVTAEHLARLLGSGVDPVTGEHLGFACGRYQTPHQRVAARLAALPEAEREGPPRSERAASATRGLGVGSVPW